MRRIYQFSNFLTPPFRLEGVELIFKLEVPSSEISINSSTIKLNFASKGMVESKSVPEFPIVDANPESSPMLAPAYDANLCFLFQVMMLKFDVPSLKFYVLLFNAQCPHIYISSISRNPWRSLLASSGLYLS